MILYPRPIYGERLHHLTPRRKATQRRKELFGVVYFGPPIHKRFGDSAMRPFTGLFCLLLVAAFIPETGVAQDAPKGEVTKYAFDQSKIFPGTTRDYWVYVPK